MGDSPILEQYQYRVLGVPIPLQRPRINKNRMYDPQTQEKASFAFQVKAQHTHNGLFEGPLRLDILFYFPVATYFSKRKSEHILTCHHEKKPDLSNLIKFVEDALNNVIYKDDAQICIISAQKLYSEVPRVDFTISRLN